MDKEHVKSSQTAQSFPVKPFSSSLLSIMESGCRDKSRPTAAPGITTAGEQTEDECVLSPRTTLTFDTGWISSSALLLGSINLPDIASAGLDATGYAVEGCDPCFQMPATRQHTLNTNTTELSGFTEQIPILDSVVSPSRWGSNSQLLDLFRDDTQQKPENNCFCHPALLNLLSHRKRIHSFQPTVDLADCRHTHRLLQWTWRMHVECGRCKDSELVKVM